jgi:tetratricopeptide (TPR) repeat protein
MKAMFLMGIILAGMVLPSHEQVAAQEIEAHLQAAREAEARQDFASAARSFELVVKLAPKNAELQNNLGIALYFNHQLPSAIAAFNRAIALDRKLFPPHLFSGLAWYHLAKTDAAVRELETAVNIQPSDVIGHTWLGYAYVAQRRYQDAAKEFDTSCQLAPDNLDAWYALGESYLQIGKNSALRLASLAPDGGRVLQLAAEQFLLRGDRARALADYTAAIVRRPDIPELRSGISELGGILPQIEISPSKDTSQEDQLYRASREAEQKSRDAFNHVMQLAPNSYRAHQILGDALVLQGKPDEAIAEYSEVVAEKPDLPGIHEDMGKEFLDSGKVQQALEAFESELQLQPNSASALTNVGRVLLMTGKDDRAVKILNAALRAERPPEETYLFLGDAYLRLKQLLPAIDMLTRYAALNKTDPEAYILLARAYKQIGNQSQMNTAIAQYKTYSLDVRKRVLAQKEMSALQRGNKESSDPVDVHQ